MMQAIWNGKVLAESDNTVVVEGNYYFPADAVKADYLQPSKTSSFCGWKGNCSYHNIVIDGQENRDAAWYYAEPYERAENIRGHIAFWKGVTVKEA